MSSIIIGVSTFQFCKIGVNILLYTILEPEKLILKAISASITALALKKYCTVISIKITVHNYYRGGFVLYGVMPINF